MAVKKTFGERNKALSEKLLEENVYHDWVVTTAFYSSIHFVEDKVLPTQIKGQTCTNITDVKDAYNYKGRHPARAVMVYEFLGDDIGGKYQWLDDQSRNSRYKTYKVSVNLANKAKQYLNDIYKECYETT